MVLNASLRLMMGLHETKCQHVGMRRKEVGLCQPGCCIARVIETVSLQVSVTNMAVGVDGVNGR